MTGNEHQGPLFWFMSIQTANGAAFYVIGYQGTWVPKPGATRLDLFHEIRQYVGDREPRSRDGVVVAFDIQPNKI